MRKRKFYLCGIKMVNGDKKTVLLHIFFAKGTNKIFRKLSVKNSEKCWL